MFKVVKFNDNIYLFLFKNGYDHGNSFARIQEFCECRNEKFRGKYFTHEEFMEWWAKEFGNDSYDYPAWAAGCNVPGDKLKQFIELFWLKHGDVREVERALISVFIGRKLEDIYMLGAYTEDDYVDETIRHELAHALFYTDPVYRVDMQRLVRRLPPKCRKWMNGYLKENMYHTSVYVDETQAYMAAGLDDELFKIATMRTAQLPFKSLFKKYVKAYGFDKIVKKICE